MKNLWQSIPPFSPDTSGFCSVISGTDGMGIIDDAQGCVSNYRTMEETKPIDPPRICTSEISDIEVIMGTENAIFSIFEKIAPTLKPKPTFVVLAGSPIASIIGTDLRIVADEFYKTYHIPAINVELTGHDTYDNGISLTLEALGRLFLQPSNESIPKSVNILGCNHVDMGDYNSNDLCNWIQEHGFSVISAWGHTVTMAQMQNASKAEVNLVVTASALPLAKWMKKTLHIPYICGIPFGITQSELLIKQMIGVKNNTLLSPINREETILLIGEQFQVNALRNALRLDYGFNKITVASFFSMESDYLEDGDIHLNNEEEFEEFITGKLFDICFCDPFFKYILPRSCRWISFPHRGVSNKLFIDQIPQYIGEKANKWLTQTLSCHIMSNVN